jgi:hypothetical protein
MVTKIKSIARSISSNHHYLFYLFILSLSFAFLYQTLLVNIFICNTFYNIGLILNNISLSIIAGLIIYFITVTLPHYRNKMKLNSYFNYKINSILHDLSQFILQLATEANHNGAINNQFEDEIEEWNYKLKFINNYSIKSSELIKFENWENYFSYYYNSINASIEGILQFSHLIEDKILLSITNIDNVFSRRILKDYVERNNSQVQNLIFLNQGILQIYYSYKILKEQYELHYNK